MIAAPTITTAVTQLTPPTSHSSNSCQVEKHSTYKYSSWTSNNTSSPHALFSLPTDLFCLVCSFLTLEDKLLGVIQLCHAVQSCFSPFCFTTNALGQAQSRALSHKPSLTQAAPGSKLLSMVYSVGSALHTPSSLLLFTRMTKLDIQAKSFICTEQAFLQLVRENPAFFHHLIEITLSSQLPEWEFSKEIFPRLSTVTARLKRAAVRDKVQLQRLMQLVSLPSLISLEIGQRSFHVDNPSLELHFLPTGLIQQLSWTRLRRVTLPHIYWKEDQHQDWFLSKLPKEQATWPLKYLTLHGNWHLQHVTVLPDLVFLFPYLVTLDLSLLHLRRTVDVGSSSTGSTDAQCRLPSLRHLLLPECNDDDVSSYPALLSLVMSVSTQLTVLSCQALNEWRFIGWPSLLRYVFHNMPALCNLHIRRRLEWADTEADLSQDIPRMIAAAVSDCCLSHLHTLSLYGIQLTTQSMEALFCGLPQLHDVDLEVKRSVLNPQVIAVIGIHCPFIRSIRASVGHHSVWKLDTCITTKQQQRLEQCQFTPFSHLQLLYIECWRNKDAITFSTSGLSALLQMLHAAPLIHLTLRGYLLTCPQLMMLVSFHSLRFVDAYPTYCRFQQFHTLDTYPTDRPGGVCLHGAATLWNNQYTTENPHPILSPAVTTEIQSIDRLAQGHEVFRQRRFFRQSVIAGHEHADRQGREAFFFDLQQHVQQGCTGEASWQSRLAFVVRHLLCASLLLLTYWVVYPKFCIHFE